MVNEIADPHRHESEKIIRVVIADEVRLVCHVMAAMLQNENDIDVVGYATLEQDALALADRCDVLLVSTTLPENGALNITQALADKPEIKVVVFGLGDSEAAILKYIEAGAAGYVLKEDSVDELLKTVRTLARGGARISPQIAAALISRVAELAALSQQSGAELYTPPNLTQRETEVLDLVSQGLSNAEIAERLNIELGTVKNHVHNILRKLEVSTRGDAISYLNSLTNKSPDQA